MNGSCSHPAMTDEQPAAAKARAHVGQPSNPSALLARILAIVTALLPPTAVGDADGASDELLRGIDPIVHVRTYYWDSTNLRGEPIEAWALGGWAGFTTRWYGDSLQLGLVGYRSQKLYGPTDKDGSLLLAPGQTPLNIVGQAFVSLRVAGQTASAYRQMIDQPWVDPQDNRMIPNLFEAYLLSGEIANVDYIGGYVTKAKTRGSDSFQWMSSVAGSSGPRKGMALFGARFRVA